VLDIGASRSTTPGVRIYARVIVYANTAWFLEKVRQRARIAARRANQRAFITETKHGQERRRRNDEPNLTVLQWPKRIALAFIRFSPFVNHSNKAFEQVNFKECIDAQTK
jgi:hypothetical protein